MQENLTWFDKGQEYYFDYPIGDKMKESDIKLIESLNLEKLTTLETVLYLEKWDGSDVEECLTKVQEEIGKRYPNATDEELQNLHFQMSRLAEEGHDFLEPMQNIENELIGRKESGTIYEAE